MSTENACAIQVVIPFHQPLSADDEVIAAACEACYEPLLSAIEARDGARIALHFTGHLLDYLAKRREDILLRIRELADSGRVEVLGGIFYGGFAALLPEDDIGGQLQMSREFWESFLGETPSGYWLPELAWAPELPRLLQDSGFDYGFVSDTQLWGRAPGRELVTVARGEQQTALFVLDSQLSRALPVRAAEEWLDALIDRAAGSRVTSVWVRAESLGLEPGTADWCYEHGWLERWLDAICGGRSELRPQLPAEGLQSTRPAEPASVDDRCAAELGALASDDEPPRWESFVDAITEVQTLWRRMLRAGDKLRDAIATMEDEELDDEWSDGLATAQRAVFAAQAPDAYWRGASPGWTDPAERDAATARIVEAEEIIDSLIQGEDDWISEEEEDRDGDLEEEIFVTTARLGLWWVPSRGQLRTVDVRGARANVLDVGNRRAEPFFADMRKAPPVDLNESHGVAIRGEGLGCLSDDLPTNFDDQERAGVRTWVFDERTSAEEFFSSSAVDLFGRATAWSLESHVIDEDGDCSFRGVTNLRTSLEGVRERVFRARQEVTVPIDASKIDLAVSGELEGEPEVVLALEVPVRLGVGEHRVWAGGKELSGTIASAEQVRQVEVHGGRGSFAMSFAQPVDLWCLRIDTSVRTLRGYERMPQGVVLVPNVRLDGGGAIQSVLHFDGELPPPGPDAQGVDPSELTEESPDADATIVTPSDDATRTDE